MPVAGPGVGGWARDPCLSPGPPQRRSLGLQPGDTLRPLRRFSVDEGVTWSTHNFTGTSVFVDGLLSEPGDETLVMT